MSGDSAGAVHRALVAALKADSLIASLVGDRVSDWPAVDTVFPCITLGDITSKPWDSDTTEGAELSVVISAWAKGTDARAKAREIGEAIATLLHRNEAALSVTGHTVELVERASSQVLRDETSEAQTGGATARALCMYRMLTDATI